MRSALVVLLCSVANIVAGQNHDAALKDYLTDDVMAVAYVDVTKIDTVGHLQMAEKLGFGQQESQQKQAVEFMRKVQQQVDTFAKTGVTNVYVLFRISDVAHGGPTWVVPVAEEGNPQAAMGMILSGRPDRMELELDARPSFFPLHCEVAGRAVLGANSAEQLQQLKTNRPTAKRDLSAAWEALGEGHCGVILFGDKDSRKVLREMFPKLPAPFESINGPLLADRLLWGGAVAKFLPTPELNIVVQTDHQTVANDLQDTTNKLLETLSKSRFANQYLNSDELQGLMSTLTPKIEGERLIVSFEDVLSDFDRLSKLLSPPVNAARQAAQRARRMNNFKQIALGMLNYESANGTLPPRSTYAEDGKPLLSWRVHILPYMDQGKLYDQFHLDEPWDSEHNRELIPLMPDFYADPDPALKQRNDLGMTTFLVPAAKGTMFSGPDGTLYKEIKDGSSNTILLVEVAPLAAHTWTQPKDWLVDLDSPWERLLRKDRKWFTAAYCDGSVRIIPFSTSAKSLRALLTIDAGDLVE